MSGFSHTRTRGRVSRTNRKTTWGLRMVAGLSYWIPKAPVELFGELAPFLEFREEHREDRPSRN